MSDRDPERGDDHDNDDDTNHVDIDHGDHGDATPADHGDHNHHTHDLAEVGAAVVTVSSTRSREDDPSGDVVETAFENAGHEVVIRELVADDFDRVQTIVDRVVERADVDVVVTTGGTGVTPDDVTIEAVDPLLDKRLPGFGELFRSLSYDEVGTRVVGTRATAGVADGVPVFCLPGSENAAGLGTREVVVPEAPHLAGLAGRPEQKRGPTGSAGEQQEQQEQQE